MFVVFTYTKNQSKIACSELVVMLWNENLLMLQCDTSFEHQILYNVKSIMQHSYST